MRPPAPGVSINEGTSFDDALDEQEHLPRRERLNRSSNRFGRSFSVSGLTFAFAFFLGSLAPSLVPRTWLFQGIASGLSLASGYAVGAFLGWLGRNLGIRPSPRQGLRVFAWSAFAGVGLGAVVGMMVLSVRWQSDLRERFGMPAVDPSYALVVLVALVLAVALVLLGRGLWFVVRGVAVVLDRWLPAVVAHVLAAAAVIAVVAFALDGTVVRYAMAAADAAYARIDEGTEPGVSRPSAPERSGSPESEVPWESLGSQGRTFVAGGPSQHDLLAFAQRRAGETAAAEPAVTPQVRVPVRVYAGLDAVGESGPGSDPRFDSRSEPGSDQGAGPDAEPDLEAAARLVVAELDRTDAWDRQVLVVATATGTGWVDPSMAEAIELMYGGDTAIASMQYSYLPSWVSLVADRQAPAAAGRALFEAVHAAWATKPADHRPLLLVFGESLGSYGGQAAFTGVPDLTARADGALWVGTPHFTETWAYLTAHRDRGSLERSPVYDHGRQVRWGTGVGRAADVWDRGPAWERPRVVYVQHASDPVVWWSADLVLHEPDWLREPKGPDVLPGLRWMPFVTFWQLTIDLFATDIPPGHGHTYATEYADAWSAVAAPDGWTDADTARLAEALAVPFE